MLFLWGWSLCLYTSAKSVLCCAVICSNVEVKSIKDIKKNDYISSVSLLLLCILFLLIAICFWRSYISLNAFPMPWILHVFEYPLSICIQIFILCVIPSTALIHQDGCVKLHKTLACKNFDLWCHQQESNWSRGQMICFSIMVPYDPMDFRAVCQCCNEHKDIELNAWYKKHDKKKTKCFWNIAFQQQPKVKCKYFGVLGANSLCLRSEHFPN